MKQETKSLTTTIAFGLIGIFLIGGIFALNKGQHQADLRQSKMSTNDPPAGLGGLLGKSAPQFLLRDRNGVEYSVDRLKGKNVVLFFNEGLMCYPACWNQMVALATDPRFSGSDTAALSIVIDQPSDWQSAIRKMPDLGKATVLFDSGKSVSQSFGMLTVPSSMHYGSYPGHSFVLIDKQGIVRYVLDDPNMGIDNDRVFAELDKLN